MSRFLLFYVLKMFERFLISMEVVRGGMTEEKRLGNGGRSSDGRRWSFRLDQEKERQQQTVRTVLL